MRHSLYFVHRGQARFEVGGEVLELGPGGLCHVESTPPRRFVIGDEDPVVLVVGGKDGYVGRDGRLVNPDDAEKRRNFGTDVPGPAPRSAPLRRL